MSSKNTPCVFSISIILFVVGNRICLPSVPLILRNKSLIIVAKSWK